MIRAAIDPETGNLIGLIIPAEDLGEHFVTVFGTAEDWGALLRGEDVDQKKIGVVTTSKALDESSLMILDSPLASILVDNKEPS